MNTYCLKCKKDTANIDPKYATNALKTTRIYI